MWYYLTQMKIRDGKIVISCGDRPGLEKTQSRLKSQAGLKLEPRGETETRELIVRNVFGYNTEADIIESLKCQNQKLWRDLDPAHFRVKEVYRRKARNPHQVHVVLQVSPQVWRKLTEAGTIYIDIQGLTAEDQSPLVQCTRCLGYGHGRRNCKETVDLCSHCGGGHDRTKCPSRVNGRPPVCRNCDRAGFQEAGHNAFSGDCPIRRKWDGIARSS
ncbi:TRAS3 protein, partial [Danaus plexippus plexippus]